MNELPYVAIEELTRAFGRTYALHHLSCRLVAGEITLVLGPNGAGKSTFLAILATLDRPTSGSVQFGPDHDLLMMQRRGRQAIGWLSHDALVYNELTGRENLEFYAQLYGLGDPESLVDRWITRVGLESSQGRPVATYSRGMRQRLSLARALLHSPKLLILDEPLSGLDREGRGLAFELLEEARAQKMVVVLSTHILELPDGLIDRVLVLRRGRKKYFGPPTSSLVSLYESKIASGQRAANG